MWNRVHFPRRALGWGLLHLAGAVFFFAWFDPATFGIFTEPDGGPIAVVTTLGVFLLGVMVGALYYEYGLVTPAVLVAALFVYMSIAAVESIRSPAASASPTVFHYYLFVWPLVSVLAFLVGGGESLIRRQGRLTPGRNGA